MWLFIFTENSIRSYMVHLNTVRFRGFIHYAHYVRDIVIPIFFTYLLPLLLSSYRSRTHALGFLGTIQTAFIQTLLSWLWVLSIYRVWPLAFTCTLRNLDIYISLYVINISILILDNPILQFLNRRQMRTLQLIADFALFSAGIMMSDMATSVLSHVHHRVK